MEFSSVFRVDVEQLEKEQATAEHGYRLDFQVLYSSGESNNRDSDRNKGVRWAERLS